MCLNFVEVMTLNRAFSVGRFKCSGIIAKITPEDFIGDGYVLRVPKESAHSFCLNCIKSFFDNGRIQISEDEQYVILQSP